VYTVLLPVATIRYFLAGLSRDSTAAPPVYWLTPLTVNSL